MFFGSIPVGESPSGQGVFLFTGSSSLAEIRGLGLRAATRAVASGSFG